MQINSKYSVASFDSMLKQDPAENNEMSGYFNEQKNCSTVYHKSHLNLCKPHHSKRKEMMYQVLYIEC